LAVVGVVGADVAAVGCAFERTGAMPTTGLTEVTAGAAVADSAEAAEALADGADVVATLALGASVVAVAVTDGALAAFVVGASGCAFPAFMANTPPPTSARAPCPTTGISKPGRVHAADAAPGARLARSSSFGAGIVSATLLRSPG
jgi:hypothetical protein